MIRLMEEADVIFFNEVRNECREWLHDPKKYSHEEALSWFNNNKDPFFIYELNAYQAATDSRVKDVILARKAGVEKIGYFRTSNWTEDSCFVGMDICKDFRGKGLATQAYEEFFEMLKEAYSIYIYKLNVLAKNDRAYNLYKKLDFEEVKREPHEHGENITMVRYDWGWLGL